MASLNGTFDASSVDPSTPRETLPPGDYQAQIVNSEMRTTKDGSGQYLWLEMAIIDGHHSNARIFDRLNLVNNNQQAAEIAQRTLSAICHACNVMQVDDSEQLHMRPMTVKVIVKPAQGNYAPSNEVKGYSAPKSGGGYASQPAPRAPMKQNAAPAKQPAPQPAASRPSPWKRSG